MFKRPTLVILALLFLTIGVPWKAVYAQAATATGAGPVVTEEFMLHDERNRRFLVHDYSGDQPAPVVLILHGGGGHAENAVNMTQFGSIGEREGLILVYPDGSGGSPGGRLLTWNAGDCCAYAMLNNIDDVGFIEGVIDTLVASGRADPARIYVTGMSNGAMMTHRLARELGSKIAAIAPVVGAVFGNEAPATAPVPTFVMVGADDTVVPGAGGAIGSQRDRLIANLPQPPAARAAAPAIAQAQYWAHANDCREPEAVTTRNDGTRIQHWGNCSSGADVMFAIVAANGHAWPGGQAGRDVADQPTREYNASAEMWAFFKRHTKPAEPTLEAAFYYAFPLYEIARTGQNRERTTGLNKLQYVARLLDHTSRQITAPNNDTVYASAQLELSGGPVEVIAPYESERYYSIAFMDAFTDNFAYIGSRATGGNGGRFWVVGPQWEGSAPEGVQVIRSSTNDVWMLGRTVVYGPEDLRAANAFQQQITVRPVSSATPAKPLAITASDVLDPANFLAVVNDMLARSPGGEGHTARAEAFAAFGIGAGITPTAEQLEVWRDFIPVGIDKLREKFLIRDHVVNGWGYQEEGIGNFGDNDLLRASVALGGLAALTEEEAMYFQATTTASGELLTGQRAYRWRIPPGGIPADAFWSLTMYQVEEDGRFFLVENPINRYSIGDRTLGLITNADGSVDILIQHERPQDEMAANWLPAPAGKMRLALRAYLPRQELRDRSWQVPPLEFQE